MLEASAELEEKEGRLTEVTQERDGVYKRLGRSKQFNSADARDRWIKGEVEKINEKVKEKEQLAREVEAHVEETKERLREVEVFENEKEEKEQRFRDSVHGKLTELTKAKADYRSQLHELSNEVLQLRHQLQAKEEHSKDVLNRLRGMPNMKQVLQGMETINKILEETPHLKAGYNGLVTISLFLAYI